MSGSKPTLRARVAAVIGAVAASVGAGLAHAQSPHITAGCRVPGELIASRANFERLGKAVRAKQPIRILVLGTASSLGAGTSGASAAYPQRLATALSKHWGGLGVSIVNASKRGETAQAMRARLPDLMKGGPIHLVIWQTATVDALRGVDLNDFADAIEAGLKAVDEGGADLALVDSQFGGPLGTIADPRAYSDYLAQVLRGWNAMLVRRYAMMQHWAENGTVDLTAKGRVQQQQVADRVHECLAQAMTAMIIEATE